MEAPTKVEQTRGRPASGRPFLTVPMRQARHYQDLARQHRDEELFWLCRASYFGRLSLRLARKARS